MPAHEFTYANIGHGEKDLIISACSCGASRILVRTASKRYEWRVIEQIGTLPACLCPPEEEEEDTMHAIEGFHVPPSAQVLECRNDQK